LEADAVGVVRRVMDACAAGDFDAVAALYHPEAEIVGGVLLGRGEQFTGGTARSWGTPLVSEWISWAAITVRDGLVYQVKVFRTEQEGRLEAGLATVGDRDI
jgi:hypothetical protein